jgi:hypothetical protein
LINRDGSGVVLDSDSKCSNCHHDISSHACER